MKIAVFSDLHLELQQHIPFPAESPDVVILAGDIARGTDALSIAFEYRKKLDVPVLLVAGNHEFYRGDFHKSLFELRKAADRYSDKNVFFLENESIALDGVRFLGCTLWTDFSLYGADRRRLSIEVGKKTINDFRMIRCGNRSLRPDDLSRRYSESLNWLDSELSRPVSGKTVVITHFAPHRAAIHPRYLQDDGDESTPFFVTDCAHLMHKHSIDTWIYGHTHNSVDCIVESETRLISNQLGYPGEPIDYTRFDPNKTVVI